MNLSIILSQPDAENNNHRFANLGIRNTRRIRRVRAANVRRVPQALKNVQHPSKNVPSFPKRRRRGALMEQQPLAFGVEPSRYRYRLRLARYMELAEAVANVARQSATRGQASLELLDLGVGRGRTLRYLEPHRCVERIRFVGVDVSAHRLAQVYGGKRWTLLQHDIQDGLPFESASFDVIVCEQVLEHLRAPQAAVAEMARILRPGGTLIVGVPIFPRGIDQVRRRMAARYNAWLGRRSDHPQTFTLRSLRRILEQTGAFDIQHARGFRIVSGGVLGFLENSRWWWRCNRALGKMVPWACTEVQIVACKPIVNSPADSAD